MTTRILVMVSAAIEVAAGVALIAVPDAVARVLLGVGLSEAGVAVGRVGGFGLLSLGLAYWPRSGGATPPSLRGLFAYNLLAGLYFGYLRIGGGFTGPLLWPACVLHVLLALLMARPAYESFLAVRAAGASES